MQRVLGTGVKTNEMNRRSGKATRVGIYYIIEEKENFDRETWVETASSHPASVCGKTAIPAPSLAR